MNNVPNTSPVNTATGIRFDICEFSIFPKQKSKKEDWSWLDRQQSQMDIAASIAPEDGTLWMRITRNGTFQLVDNRADAALGFRVIPYRFSVALAMISLSARPIVNGLPALSVSIMRARDSFLPIAGSRSIYYVNELFTPYVGPPTEEMLAAGGKCPCCLVPFDSESSTIVAMCKCGLAYHHETPETHPHVEPEELLDCFGQLGKCSRCGRKLTTEPSLAWNPGEL